MIELSGASVVVTGASSGIGAALAQRLSERGTRLGLVGRDPERLARVADACREYSKDVYEWQMDLGDLPAVDRLASEAWNRLGGVDVLVNNAAIPKRRHVLALGDDELEEVMRVNFLSPVRLSMRLLPQMIDRGSGCVVNVSSMGGRLGIINETAYSASKFALTGWTEAAALDLWDEPVTIKLITPGAIDTAIWSRPDNDEPDFSLDLEPASTVAESIIAAMQDGPFETFTPDLSSIVAFKTADIEAFQAAAVAAARERE